MLKRHPVERKKLKIIYKNQRFKLFYTFVHLKCRIWHKNKKDIKIWL
jgi:hypothetical protein